MLRYSVRRIAGSLLILAVVSFVTFMLFFAIPGDPAQLSCQRDCSPERLADIRAALGIENSVFVQYADFMQGIFAGRDYTFAGETIRCNVPCFGYSFANQEEVWPTIVDRFPATLSLALGAAALFLLVGVGMGAIAALRAGSIFDRVLIAFSLVGASVQVFFIGPLLRNIFVDQLGWLPRPSYTPITEDPAGWFGGLILPWVVIALVSVAVYARLTRASALEALGEDFVRAGRSRGLGARQLHLKHTGRATITPVITVFGLDLAGLLAGAIITETVFNIPGIGKLALTAVDNNDLPIIMATVLISATFILVANLIVDLAYGVVDPRVRLR
ncbi:MAG: ABC transporter permease [Sporichthyaceae bacterium]